MIRPRPSRADLIREQMDMEGTFCGPLPAKRGSIAAQRQAADPFGNVGSAPADAASAKVNGRRKLARLDAPPDGRAAPYASEVQHLLAGQQFRGIHDTVLGREGCHRDRFARSRGSLRAALPRRIWKAGERLSSKQELPVPCDAPIFKFDSFCRKEQNRNLSRSELRLTRYENTWEHMWTMSDTKKSLAVGPMDRPTANQCTCTAQMMCTLAQLQLNPARLVFLIYFSAK